MLLPHSRDIRLGLAIALDVSQPFPSSKRVPSCPEVFDFHDGRVVQTFGTRLRPTRF